MTDHYLKVEVPYYYAIRDGRKPFEARKNDREYEEGDRLILCPFTAGLGFVEEPGMEPLIQRVSYVQTFGMAEGYVGLGLQRIAILDPGYARTTAFRALRDAKPFSPEVKEQP